MNQPETPVAVVADRTTPDGAAVVDALLASGARVVVRGAADGHERLTSYDGDGGPAGLVDFAAEQFGRVDVVVLSAGQPAGGTLVELDEQRWAAATAQLDGIVWGMRASLRRMVPQGSGRVVVTMGAEAKVGRPGAAADVLVAHGAYGLVKAAAKEAGPSGVTVNAVLAASHTEGSLVGRTTAPEEIAAAVALLASPAGGGMSGVAFPVDGGIAPY